MERNVLCRTFPVQRQLGQNAVAGAAYRAGETLIERGRGEEGQDRVHRYAGRSLIVQEAFILTPDQAPAWAQDRAELWNRVEETETRKNARVGREVQLGLAYELTRQEQRALVVEFANREFVSKGFAVDVAIHSYGKTIPAIGPDASGHDSIRQWAAGGLPFLERSEASGIEAEHVLILRNRADEVTGYKHYQPHAHLRVTPRPFTDEAFAASKAESRLFDRHETAMRWRYEWPKLQNAYLERAGSAVRVRSTGDDETGYPSLPRMAESGNATIHAIGQREHSLDGETQARHEAAKAAEARDLAFRAIHNETIRQSYRDDRTETEPNSRDGREQMRLAAWWRNMAQRFNQWRFEFREQAEAWRERFSQQAAKLQSLIGWHPPASDGPRDDRTEPPPPKQPEQER